MGLSITHIEMPHDSSGKLFLKGNVLTPRTALGSIDSIPDSAFVQLLEFCGEEASGQATCSALRPAVCTMGQDCALLKMAVEMRSIAKLRC